mmetsp:Transcript_42941/g.108663  ORF Transcript_42941/g.108663 Transcript_42941/m.108663 type:complete len:231 (+) Transcript_42941:108-800(+)
MGCHPAGRPAASAARSGFPAAADAPASAAPEAGVDSARCLAAFTFSRQSPATGWKFAFPSASPLASCWKRHCSISRSRLRFCACTSNFSASARAAASSASRSALLTASHLFRRELAPLGSLRAAFFLASFNALSFLPLLVGGAPVAASEPTASGSGGHSGGVAAGGSGALPGAAAGGSAGAPLASSSPGGSGGASSPGGRGGASSPGGRGGGSSGSGGGACGSSGSGAAA